MKTRSVPSSELDARDLRARAYIGEGKRLRLQDIQAVQRRDKLVSEMIERLGGGWPELPDGWHYCHSGWDGMLIHKDELTALLCKCSDGGE